MSAVGKCGHLEQVESCTECFKARAVDAQHGRPRPDSLLRRPIPLQEWSRPVLQRGTYRKVVPKERHQFSNLKGRVPGRGATREHWYWWIRYRWEAVGLVCTRVWLKWNQATNPYRRALYRKWPSRLR